jgi:hypothetical protein
VSPTPKEESWGALIHRAFAQCDISVPNGWLLYRIAGGQAGQDAFRSWVQGSTSPRIEDYPYLAAALNQRAREIGKEPLLPELPFHGPRPDPRLLDLTGSYVSITDASGGSLDGADLDGIAA